MSLKQQRQKDIERKYVQRAIELLKTPWSIVSPDDWERPDFILADQGHQFGLEVTNIFTSSSDRAEGSSLRKIEGDNSKVVAALFEEYAAHCSAPLSVKFLGNMAIPDSERPKIMEKLCAPSLTNADIGHHETFEFRFSDNGLPLKIFATRGFNHRWTTVNDAVGWAHDLGVEELEKVILDKAHKLTTYKASIPSEDVRLLIVADRRRKSGKFDLQHAPEINLRGFTKVYCLIYPEYIVEFPQP